jgi:hypothetical protein
MLSRILLAVGLLVQESYSQAQIVFLSARARALQVYRGVFGAFLMFLLMVLLIWLFREAGLPAKATTLLFGSANPMTIARGVLLLLGDVFFGTVVVLPFVAGFHFLFDLAIRGRLQDESAVLFKTLESLKEHIVWECIFVACMTILFGIMI